MTAHHILRACRVRGGPGLAAALASVLLLAGPFGLPARAEPPGAAIATPTPEQPLDLNRASLEEIERLPISRELAWAIYDYRTYSDLFKSIYDLFKVPGMNAEIFASLKPIVIVAPRFMVVEDSREDERLESVYDLVQRLLSQEGVSEGLVDEYIDLLRVPRNVNSMDYYALTAIQNVSPVDAVAILKARRDKPFESTQELRRTDGLSYWGYRNLRDFITYSDSTGSRWEPAGDYQVRVYNTPYSLDDWDILNDQLTAAPRVGADLRNSAKNSLWGRLKVDASHPYTTNKLRLRLGNTVKLGLLTHRNLGEQDLDETSKWYAGVEGLAYGPFKLHHAYLGNYRLAIGQGLVMDNTDFFQARRTGQGYSVRPIGVRGDVSRSDEYTLKGAAIEGSIGPARLSTFYSNDNKDAILNPDYSFNHYVTMVPRVSNETLADIRNFVAAGEAGHFLPMRDVMKEKLFGMNLKLDLWTGTYVGLTGMEFRYKNRLFRNSPDDSLVNKFNPAPASIIVDPDRRKEPRDADLEESYDSRQLGNFRDLVGAEFGTTYKNVSLAGEYGKLLTTGVLREYAADSLGKRRLVKADTLNSFFGRAFHYGPEAYLASAYVQYENFNFFALYRDIDLAYDNPYNRAFAETNRYDQTLAGDEFRLWNPVFSFLAENDPQTKPEKGFYFTTRYQVNRHLTINYLEYDNYVRKTDNTKSQRLTLSLEYRPVFPVRFRVRQRYSERDGKGEDDERSFTGWDSRFEARFFLSRYDRLEFLYSTTNVIFQVRPRLSGAPGGGATNLGTAGSPAQAFQAKLTHNFSPGLSTTLSSEIYDGFLWNFEDNEFLAFDGRGYRNWFLVRSRLSNALSWRLKYTVDYKLPVTWVDFRNYNTGYGLDSPTPDGTNARETLNSFRFQLDYSF